MSFFNPTDQPVIQTHGHDSKATNLNSSSSTKNCLNWFDRLQQTTIVINIKKYTTSGAHFFIFILKYPAYYIFDRLNDVLNDIKGRTMPLDLLERMAEAKLDSSRFRLAERIKKITSTWSVGSPLQYACKDIWKQTRKFSPKIYKILISVSGDDLNHRDAYKKTPLMNACKSTNINAVIAIFEHAQTNAQKRALLTTKDESGMTPIEHVYYDKGTGWRVVPEEVKTLFNEMFKGFSQEEIKEILTTKDDDGFTPIMHMFGRKYSLRQGMTTAKIYEIISGLYNKPDEILKETMQDEKFPEILGNIFEKSHSDFIHMISQEYSNFLDMPLKEILSIKTVHRYHKFNGYGGYDKSKEFRTENVSIFMKLMMNRVMKSEEFKKVLDKLVATDDLVNFLKQQDSDGNTGLMHLIGNKTYHDEEQQKKVEMICEMIGDAGAELFMTKK